MGRHRPRRALLIPVTPRLVVWEIHSMLRHHKRRFCRRRCVCRLRVVLIQGRGRRRSTLSTSQIASQGHAESSRLSQPPNDPARLP